MQNIKLINITKTEDHNIFKLWSKYIAVKATEKPKNIKPMPIVKKRSDFINSPMAKFLKMHG